MELAKRTNEVTNINQRPHFQKGVEWILADRSGSMSCSVPGTDKSRLECLVETINSYGPHIQTIAFDNVCSLHVGPVELYPRGGTNMAKALTRVQQYEPNYILIISDGCTSNPTECERLAGELANYCLIDTLYIGPDNPMAEEFMSRLATIGNGRFRKFDLSKPQTLSLTSVVQGFLPAPEEIIES